MIDKNQVEKLEMIDNNQVEKSVYEQEYIPYLLKEGRIATTIAFIAMFLPILLFKFYYKIELMWEYFALPFSTIIGMTLSTAAGPFYTFPMLGLPGTLMGYIVGDINNIRIPCSLAAIEAAEVEMGTEESSVISAIGIGISVIVKVVIVFVGMTILFSVLSKMPPSVAKQLALMVPALIGAVTVRFCIIKPKTIPMVVVIGLACFYLTKLGIIPSQLTTMVIIFACIGISYLLFKKNVLE